MKRTMIAAALFSLFSVAAVAGAGTTSSSTASSGGQTSASVSGFGSFKATDYGMSNANAQAVAGNGFHVTGNGTNATTSHINSRARAASVTARRRQPAARARMLPPTHGASWAAAGVKRLPSRCLEAVPGLMTGTTDDPAPPHH